MSVVRNLYVRMSMHPFMRVSNLSSLLISEPEDRLANDTSTLLSLYHLREEEGQPVRADPYVRTDVHSARLKRRDAESWPSH